MRITGYTKADFDRVMEINDACYPEGVYRPSREIMSDYLSVSDVYLAKVGHVGDLPEEIIGFAIVRNALQPYIWNIAVDPVSQGRSVGTALLCHIIDFYTNARSKQISLHTNVNNPAQKLYFDNGFRIVSVQENYFGPDDGLVMVRRLD